jgi:hypothetical protein
MTTTTATTTTTTTNSIARTTTASSVLDELDSPTSSPTKGKKEYKGAATPRDIFMMEASLTGTVIGEKRSRSRLDMGGEDVGETTQEKRYYSSLASSASPALQPHAPTYSKPPNLGRSVSGRKISRSNSGVHGGSAREDGSGGGIGVHEPNLPVSPLSSSHRRPWDVIRSASNSKLTEGGGEGVRFPPVRQSSNSNLAEGVEGMRQGPLVPHPPYRDF